MRRTLLLAALLLSADVLYAFPDNAVIETFTGVDNTSPPNANWTNAEIKNGINAGGLDIEDNAVAPSATGGTYGGYYNAATYGPDAEVYSTIVDIGSTSTFGNCLVTTPGIDSADGYCVEAQDAVGEVYILRLDNGAPTTLATITQAITTTDKIGLKVSGGQICAWFADSGGAWTQLSCQPDATYSSSAWRLAIYLVGNTGVGGMDNFGGGTITAASFGQLKRRAS